MYADDNQIYYSGKNAKEVELRTNQDIRKASQWVKKNHLKAKKKQIPSNDTTKSNEKVGKITVMADESNEAEQTPCLKLLGNEVDKELSFSIHINNLCKKVSQRVGAICRFHKIMSIKAKSTI